MIARYHAKRVRRVWNKKIRYGCRKNLADRRLRVKGRFVKRSQQQEFENQFGRNKSSNHRQGSLAFVKENDDLLNDAMPDVNNPDAGFAPTGDQPYRRSRRHTVT
jgi:hypothetical protein